MIDPTTTTGARVAERLEQEAILWLTTVTADGQPQASPVWFLWADGEILLYSRADTPRPANVRRNPRVAATFDGNGRGGDDRLDRGQEPGSCGTTPARPTSRPPTPTSTAR